jgi:hypothetical protein
MPDGAVPIRGHVHADRLKSPRQNQECSCLHALQPAPVLPWRVRDVLFFLDDSDGEIVVDFAI